MINDFFANWTKLIIRFRVIVLAVVFGLTAFFTWSITEYLIVENSFDTFFPKGDPTIAEFNKFRDVFGTKHFVFVLVETEHPLSIEKLRLIDELTADFEENVPYMSDAVGPTTAELLIGTEDAIEVHKIRDYLDDEERVKELTKLFRSKDIYKNGLISEDGRYLGILLNTVARDPNAANGMHDVTVASQQMTAAIYKILKKDEYKSLNLYPVGDPIFNDQYGRWTNNETYRMFIWIVVLLLMMLTLIFRKLSGIIVPVLTVVFTVAWTFGLIALSIKLRVTSTILPPLLCAVGIADSIHILTEFDALKLEIPDHKKALVETLRIVGYPCLLTSITTAVGFLSLSMTPVLPLQETGIFAAAGVMIAFLLTTTMVIALLSFSSGTGGRRRAKTSEDLFSVKLMDCVYKLTDRRKALMILGWISLTAFFGTGMYLIDIDADWLRNFGEEVRIRQDYEYADSVMGGSAAFEIMIDTKHSNRAKNPELLKEIDRFSTELKEHKDLHVVFSLVDVLKETNRALHAENPAFFKPPETPQMAAQLLLLYSMAGGESVDELTDGKKRYVRITVRVPFDADSVWKGYMALIIETLEKHVSVPMGDIIITGYPKTELALTERVLPAQIKSFAVAFVAVGFLLMVFLRSATLGVVGMIPTTLPVLFALGFMGWYGIKLDWVITMIASIGIGLAVDNAIHLFNRFRLEYDRCGNHRLAMQRALKHVGRALAFAGFILVIGFSICATSVMENVANFGRLSVLLIGVSFLAAILFAPPLLVLIRPFGKDREPDLPLD